MDKFTSIKTFLAVARHGGFTAAADELGMSKAMVSKYVSALENSLGVRLLNRTTRRIKLTEEGIAYRERMRDILHDIEETELAVAQQSSEPMGTLRVMAPTSFGSFHLARAVADYREAFRSVAVEMILTERIPDIIEEGIDVTIRVGELEESSFVARQIAQVRNVVCASPEYLARAGRPDYPGQLTGHNCLIYTARSPAGEWQFTINGRVQRIHVSGDVRCNLGDALRIAAIRNCGIAQLPTYIVGLDLRAGRLKPLLEQYASPARPIYAVYPHRRHLSAKIRTFVEFLWKRYHPRPYWEEWTEGGSGVSA